jgi:hypothetical protein
MRRNGFSLALLITTLVALPGCSGGNSIWVTGKLLKGGTLLSRDTKLDREIPTPGLIVPVHWYAFTSRR